MRDKIAETREFINNNRFLDETYFIVLSIILAFGILQTMGTGFGTQKPVVTVISPSMCPQLQIGDILLVQDKHFGEIEEGDIIVFDVPDRAELEINGKEYILEANSNDTTPSVKTPIGEVEMIDVTPRKNRAQDSILLKVNGEVPRFNGEESELLEGESYQIGNGTLKVNYLTDLPYGDVPVVHRVVEKREDSLETLGDNNPSQLEFESDISPDQVHGTVFLEIPRIGLVKILAMDLVGFSGDQPFVLDATPTCPPA